MGVAEIVERDGDGDLFVRRSKDPKGPLYRLTPDPAEAAAGAPTLGDRVLVRFVGREDGVVEARLVKRLRQSAHRVLGVVRKSRGSARAEPVDRRSKDSLSLIGDAAALKDGDLVLVEPAPRASRFGPHLGRVVEVLGREDHPKAASLIALHANGIVTGFSEEALAEAAAARPPSLGAREDLRDLPLVTIDPEDARDHDDAVYAARRPDGGFSLVVAIADVSAYVRPGSALDREAWTKGNSVYFPDRVEPMLPESLSAGLCSLNEGEDRAVLALRVEIAADGRKTAHVFTRALIRSAASLSYGQAQRAVDGDAAAVAGPLLEGVLKPLWDAYGALVRARSRRSPLEIESPERRIVLSPEGEVLTVAPRERFEAHRLIEEMMILANVCAAETLEAKRSPLIYRVHEAPSQEKMLALGEFLPTVGLAWTRGEPARTDRFNRILESARGGPNAEIVNEVVLRTQMQAVYSQENLGHFGLNLPRYAHFTSPIRRYADLVVHRALIRALALGAGGLTEGDIVRLEATCDHITATERAAMAAERDAADRYLAAFLESRVGAAFIGRVTGVTRFGLFVRLKETGAEGLVPISSLGAERFDHDERAHALVGTRSGDRWRLGSTVEVRLREATPVTGGLLFELLSDPEPGPPPRRNAAPPDRSPAPKGKARRR